jgi:large subunit ribosomal protein L17
LFRNLVTSLLEHERIETTEAKAKEIRGFTERMITLGKRGDLHARRRALAFLHSKEVVSKLFDDVAGRFRERAGGYTRMIKTRRRVGDTAELVAIELVERRQETAKAGQTKAQQEGKKPSKEASPAGSKPSKTAAGAAS